MRTPLRTILMLAVAAMMLAPSPASATVLMYMTTGELTRQSTLVVEGTVLHQEVVELDHLYTDTYILVSSKVHKGKATPGQILAFRTIGGSTSGVSLIVTGMARFKVGEQVLVFGAPAKPEGQKRLMVMGAALGKYTIYRDADGKQRVRRSTNDASIGRFDPKGKFLIDRHGLKVDEGRRALDALRADISRHVKQAPPRPVDKTEGGAK